MINARKRAQLKNRIDNIQSKFERLRAKYAHRNPADANTVAAWQKAIATARQQLEFATHPLVARMMKHHTQAVKDIDYVLLNDKQLPSDERRIMIEKKEMYVAEMKIYLPDEKVIAFLEQQASMNLEPETAGVGYPQGRVSEYPFVR